MSYTVKISPNKSIGKVVYIVEGQRKELTLLGHIFEKILGYTTIIAPRDKTPYIKYENPSNKNSQVFLISAKNSNISFINNNSGKEYLDTVFSTLYENYGLDLTNTATFLHFR